MYIWIDKSKIKRSSSNLKLREGRILLDLITGIKEICGEDTVATLYRIFKRAAERKAENLLEELKKHKIDFRSSGRELLNKVLGLLEAEGYFHKFELKIEHIDKKAMLRIEKPFVFDLKKLAEKNKVKLSDDELSAISGGLITGILSAIINSDVNVESFISYEERREITYILPEEIYISIEETRGASSRETKFN